MCFLSRSIDGATKKTRPAIFATGETAVLRRAGEEQLGNFL